MRTLTEDQKSTILKRRIMRLNPAPETCVEIRDFASAFLRHKLEIQNAFKGIDGRFTPLIQDGCCGD